MKVKNFGSIFSPCEISSGSSSNKCIIPFFHDNNITILPIKRTECYHLHEAKWQMFQDLATCMYIIQNIVACRLVAKQ
jgi:hypothetical protein